MERRVCPICSAEGTAEACFCARCGARLRRPDWGWQDLREAAYLVAFNVPQVALLSLLLIALLGGMGWLGDRLYAALSRAVGWGPSLGRALVFLWLLAVLFHVPLAGAYAALLGGARTGRIRGGTWPAVRRSLRPILVASASILGLWLALGLGLTRLIAVQEWPLGVTRTVQVGGWVLGGIVGFTYLHLALLEMVDQGSPAWLALRRARAALRRGSWGLWLTVGLAGGIGILGLGGLGIGVLVTGPLTLSLLVRAYLRLSPVAGTVPPNPTWPALRWRLPRLAWAGLGLLAVGLTGGLIFYFGRVPWSSASCRRSGDRLMAAGDPARAVESYREWTRLQPRSVAAHTALAEALAAAQRWTEAVQEYQTVLRLEKSAAAHLALGDLFYSRGQRAEARAHYEAALQLDPYNVEAQLSLADLQYAGGHLKEAAAAYERALQLSPDNLTAFHNLGEIRAKLGQTDLAIAAYREAARLGSEYPETYTGLAALLGKRGHWEEAVQSYEAAVRLQPQDPSLLRLLQEARDRAAWSVLGTGPLAGLELTLLSSQVNAVAGKAQGVSGPVPFEGVFLFLEIRLRNVTNRKIPSITWSDGTVWLQVGGKKILPTLLYTGDQMIRLNLPGKPWKAPVAGALAPGAHCDRVLLFPGRQFPPKANQGILQGTHFGPITVGWE